MDVVRGHRHDPGAAWTRTVVAIGNFDGVHRGHQALIAETIARARAGRARAVALTFDPHPSAVVASAPAMITSLDRRLELLAAAGLDAVVVEPFTRELAARPPEAFVDDFVLGALHASAIVVGYDFTYGHCRAGTPETLRAHGARAGVEVAIVDPVAIDGEVASSTKIRKHLEQGELEAAERLLGRPWDLDGLVVHGAKRGRAIGVPTANLAPASDLLVASGIYAVTLSVDGGAPLPAVASLGTNPTFVAGDQRVLEVHVLDFEGDLYDRVVRTVFVSRLRDERRFDSVDALIAQIREDVALARIRLAGARR